MSFRDRIVRFEWRPVVGYEGLYEVSSCGSVRRVIAGKLISAGAPIALHRHSQGYVAVTLCRRDGGRQHLVHRLVARAFIGPPPQGREVNHRDGNKQNNRAGNLEYVTRRENIRHACRLGLMRVSGEDNPMAKNTERTVLSIRRAHAKGEGGYKALGKRFRMPWGTVRNIVKRKTWGHL